MRIVKISDLSDKEKKEWEKQLKESKKASDEATKKVRKEANKKFNSQDMSLPTAKSTNNSNIPNYRQSISTKMDRLPTAKLVQDGSANNQKYTNYYNSVQVTDEMNSSDPRVSIPANVRYVLDRGKQGIKNFGNSFLQYLETSVANDNQKALDNKLFSKLYTEEGKKKLENTNTNLVSKIKEQNATQNAIALQAEQLSPTMQTMGQVSETIGNMLPTIGLSSLNPTLGTAGMFVTSSGSSSAEALENGRDIREAKISGDIKGGIEAGMEKITGGIKFLPKGTLDDTAVKFISKNVKSNVGKYLASKGYEISGEVLEEVLTDIGNNVVDRFMYQDGRKIVDFEQLGETAKITTLSTLALNALGLGGGTYNDVKNQNQINTSNLRQNGTNNQLNMQEQQIIPQNIKTSQNQNMEQIDNTLPVANENNRYTKSQLDEMLNNKGLPMQNYIYEQSSNAKVDNLRKDASKYFNNSEQTKNYISMLEKIVTDKNIEIRFDNNLKTPDGKIANGSYSNGIITINPNSSNTGEFIAIHELTHAIGTNEMIDMIENYRKSNTEFDTSVKQLLGNYNSTEITEEALADVSAQLFGNQEFINHVAQKNPNVFQKIYSEIKYLWHQFRGYTNQQQFIDDLYYKWTQAYNSNNKLNETTNYLIAGRKSLENIKNDTNSYNVGINTYNQALNLANQNVDNEIIRQQTGWFQDRNGDWKYEFSDKNMSLKNINFEEGKTYKLGDILNHSDLFTLYPQLKNYDVIFEYMKINGSYNDKYKRIKLNIRNSNLGGTLIHEIQHAIQHIENFEYGTSTKLGKSNYYNNLGEIEANDTKQRFLKEKKGDFDRNIIAPESSKQNAQHSNKKNLNVIEKMKESLYNYFNSKNKGEYEYEEDYQFSEDDRSQDNRLVDGRGRISNKIKNSNKGSFSMQDNQGRTLTKEQQEYFKDSKVRDENGNLKTMYHGSNNKFSIFKHGEAYRGSSKASVGYWFTETADGAKRFADSVWYGDTKTGAKVYEVYLDIKNPKIYEGVDNTNELNKIDYKINSLKETLRKLENKNIAIEINEQELRWANSKEELIDIAKHEGIDFEDAENYHNAIKQYNELIEEYDNKKYNDSYELFRADIYKIAGKNANEANIGGTGMYLSNEEEVVKKYVEDLKKQGYDGIIIKNTKFDNETLGKDNSQYVVFDSNQIKNVNNTKPTENPDIRYSQNNNSWQQYLDKNFELEGTKTKLSDIRLQNTQNNAPSAKNNVAETSSSKNSWSAKQEEVKNEEKIAEILEQPVEKVKEKDRTWAIMKANFVDKGIVFEELSHKTKNRELQGKWDYTLTSSARGQNAIGQARYEMNAKTKTEKQICKGLEEIRAEVGNKTNDFQNYMYHQLNIDRMTLEDRFGGDTGLNYERKGTIRNKPVFAESVTAEISQKIVNQYEQKNPEFKKWAQDVYDFNNANKQELVKSGVISQELADTLGELYPHYVPIKRVNANGSAIKVPLATNRTGVNSPLARAKGGNSDIQPLFQTLAERTMQTYSASARNNFGVELMNTLNSIQEKQQTDIDTILEDIGNAEQNAELLQDGKNGNAPTFTVFDNGEKVTFEITKDMYDALKPLSDSSLLNKNFLKGIPGKISNFRRGVLTEYNPLFLITNAIKDSQDVLINSQHALKTYSKFPEAYQQIISKGYWYNEYVRNGGEQNSYFKDGKFESDVKVNKAKSALQVPFNAISKINNVIEMVPRLAEYIASREKGISIETSMLDASRVTTNFKAGGDITKALNRNGATFLNASVQGASQQVRNIVEANTKGLKGYAVLATKYTIAGLPALILNGLIWKDDEDYEELQDYVKDNYYIVGKYGDGKFIRIPKGRTVAVIQKLVNNVSEYVNKDKKLDIDNFAKDFWTDLQFGFDNLAPNNPLDNNVISPILQVASNKSWYGEDIVPSRLQDKPKAEQYDESTDSLSIWLGKKLNISPYKINYLLDQYGGGISDVVLPMMTKQAENNVFEDKFTTDSVMKNRYPGEFYSKLDELNVKNNSEKATDEDKLKYKWFSNASKTMSDFYKQKREIQNSDLSDEEKKKQLKEIQKKINELAEGRLNEVDDIEVSGDIADVDGTQYYKYDGEWTKLSDKDNKKTQNMSLSTYADYKNKIKSETDRQREAGDISENGSLKTKDKIKVLINSNYSNKEKTELYKNYVLSSSDKEFPIIKEIFKLKENGLDINKYLDYKSQEFEADKKDDGTVKGKSISGSKKEKFFDYIDSIDNASYTQKLILYALEYKPHFSSDRDIVCNFVDSLPNKTNEEKLKIIECFPGVKIYKDGTFDY